MSATKSAKHISFRMFGLDEYLSMLFSCFISSELGSIFCNMWSGLVMNTLFGILEVLMNSTLIED